MTYFLLGCYVVLLILFLMFNHGVHMYDNDDEDKKL